MRERARERESRKLSKYLFLQEASFSTCLSSNVLRTIKIEVVEEELMEELATKRVSKKSRNLEVRSAHCYFSITMNNLQLTISNHRAQSPTFIRRRVRIRVGKAVAMMRVHFSIPPIFLAFNRMFSKFLRS